MDNQIEEVLAFNELYNNYDSIYQQAAKNVNMSVIAFWLIYVLQQTGQCTQKTFKEQLHYPKQSINSALKMLEREGYVFLQQSKQDKRSKIVHLTEKGKEYAWQFADPIIEAEIAAFSKLSSQEKETLFHLFKKLEDNLEEEMKRYVQSYPI